MLERTADPLPLEANFGSARLSFQMQMRYTETRMKWHTAKAASPCFIRDLDNVTLEQPSRGLMD
jgi:hypothetical protein